MHLKGKKVLVVGASSDLALDLNRMLVESEALVGLHYNRNPVPLLQYCNARNVKRMQGNLTDRLSCFRLVDKFVKWANGIDFLLQLSGDIRRPVHWSKLMLRDWNYDLSVNLITPFFLAQRAIIYMKRNPSGGRIILMSTASASHGGGSNSLAYGVAKAGVECMVKCLARDNAQYNILANAIAPGFFITKFHTKKMRRSQDDLEKRLQLIPLKRAGTTNELAQTVMFLLSEGASYITGQIINLSGGDWL